MIFFEDQHGLRCLPRSEISTIVSAFPGRLRVEALDGTVGYCYSADEPGQTGPCPYAAKLIFPTDQLRRIQPEGDSLHLTLASGEILNVTPKWVPSVRKFLGLDRYRPQPEPLTRVFLREYPFSIVRAKVEVLQLHFTEPRALIANLIWQARETLRPRSQVMHGKSHRGFWYNPVQATLERAGFFNGKITKESAEALYLRQLSQMVYDDRLFDYRDLGFEDEFAHQREIGAQRPDIILVIEKHCLSSTGIAVARQLGLSWIITGGISRHVAVEFFCDALHQVYQGPVFVIDYGDFDPGGRVAGQSFVHHLERYNTPCPAGPHFLILPELFTQEELDLFSRPLDPKDDRIDDWLLKTGGIHGNPRGIHADWLQPPERVFNAIRELLPSLEPVGTTGMVQIPPAAQLDTEFNRVFTEKQRLAREFIDATEDPLEKEVLSLAYSLMISGLVQNFKRSDRPEWIFEPVGCLEVLKRMLKHKDLLQGLLSGKYASLDEGCEDLGIW